MKALALLMALSLVPTRLVADPTVITAGATAFADLCAPCHGEAAEGGNGPDIRGSSVFDLHRAARGVEQMPEIELTEAEIAALAAWLAAVDN